MILSCSINVNILKKLELLNEILSNGFYVTLEPRVSPVIASSHGDFKNKENETYDDVCNIHTFNHNITEVHARRQIGKFLKDGAPDKNAYLMGPRLYFG